MGLLIDPETLWRQHERDGANLIPLCKWIFCVFFFCKNKNSQIQKIFSKQHVWSTLDIGLESACTATTNMDWTLFSSFFRVLPSTERATQNLFRFRAIGTDHRSPVGKAKYIYIRHMIQLNTKIMRNEVSLNQEWRLVKIPAQSEKFWIFSSYFFWSSGLSTDFPPKKKGRCSIRSLLII